jgi:hypothetical protein
MGEARRVVVDRDIEEQKTRLRARESEMGPTSQRAQVRYLEADGGGRMVCFWMSGGGNSGGG